MRNSWRNTEGDSREMWQPVVMETPPHRPLAEGFLELDFNSVGGKVTQTQGCEEVMHSPPLWVYKRKVSNRMSSGRLKHQVQVELDTLDIPANPEPRWIRFQDEEVGVWIRSFSFVTQLFQQSNYVYEGRVAMEMIKMTESMLNAKKQILPLRVWPPQPHPKALTYFSCYPGLTHELGGSSNGNLAPEGPELQAT